MELPQVAIIEATSHTAMNADLVSQAGVHLADFGLALLEVFILIPDVRGHAGNFDVEAVDFFSRAYGLEEADHWDSARRFRPRPLAGIPPRVSQEVEVS